jgi:hypothetical protein
MDNNNISYHPITNEEIKTTLFIETAFAHPVVMMRKKDIIDNHLQYKEEYIPSDDYKFWTDAAICNLKMANLPDTLLRYRIHQFQMSSDSTKQLERAGKTRREYALFFSDRKLTEKDLVIIENGFEGHDTSDIITLVNKLISINKENNFFNSKFFNRLLWRNIGIKINKNNLVQVITSNYSLSYKLWIAHNYISKVLRNIFKL